MTHRQADLAIFAAFIAVIVTAVAAIIAPAMYFDYRSCANKADLYRLEWTWDPLIDCQVKIQNKWVPLKYLSIVRFRKLGDEK
jgi:hypothetical protein